MSRALITSGVEQDRSRPRLSPACLRSCWKPLVAWVLLAGVILASPSVVGAALADERLEKMFGSRLGLRGEVRYTGYLAEDWVSFNLKDEGVFVPVRVDNDEVNLSLTLAWYF